MNRLVGRRTVEPTLSPDQLIVEFSGDCFDAVDVSAEAVEHSLEQFWCFVFPCSPPRIGGEHGELLQEREVKMLEQRQRHRIQVFE